MSKLSYQDISIKLIDLKIKELSAEMAAHRDTVKVLNNKISIASSMTDDLVELRKRLFKEANSAELVIPKKRYAKRTHAPKPCLKCIKEDGETSLFCPVKLLIGSKKKCNCCSACRDACTEKANNYHLQHTK